MIGLGRSQLVHRWVTHN